METNKRNQNNKGFSLVELIIVMAIMAILVGALAPQLLVYVEDSRESRDMRMVDTVFTAVQTVITSADTAQENFSGTLDQANDKYSRIAAVLPDDMDTVAEIKTKAKSAKGKDGTVYVIYTKATGKIQVFIGTEADITKATLPVVSN